MSDEVTVLEDETIEFIHDAAPRPTSPPTTDIAGLRSQPDGREEIFVLLPDTKS